MRLRRRGGRPVRALVVLLFEHLSAPDRHAQVRLLGYQQRTWERERSFDPPRPLPPVIPVVLSQGPRKWSPPPILELLEVDDSLRPLLDPFTPRLEPVVLDLALRSESALLESTTLRPLTRAALVLLKIAQKRGDVHEGLVRVAPLFQGSGPDEALRVGVRALWRYASTVSHVPPSHEVVERIRRAIGPTGEAFMSGYDQFLDEIEVKGASKVIERQLAMRFGPLDDETKRRLRSATVDELAAWGERLLTAGSLAEVFGG